MRDSTVFWKESCKAFRKIDSWSDTSHWQASQMYFVGLVQQVIKLTEQDLKLQDETLWKYWFNLIPQGSGPISRRNPINPDDVYFRKPRGFHLKPLRWPFLLAQGIYPGTQGVLGLRAPLSPARRKPREVLSSVTDPARELRPPWMPSRAEVVAMIKWHWSLQLKSRTSFHITFPNWMIPIGGKSALRVHMHSESEQTMVTLFWRDLSNCQGLPRWHDW